MTRADRIPTVAPSGSTTVSSLRKSFGQFKWDLETYEHDKEVEAISLQSSNDQTYDASAG